MSILLKQVTNSLWHAFNSLHQEIPGYVNKSKLKVLTANIATLLDLYGVEKGLEHYRSTPNLSFDHFRFYLAQEVFQALSNSLQLNELRRYAKKIDEVCWLVCRKNYLATPNSIYTDQSVYKLFRVFCLLADLVVSNQNNNEISEVVMHSSEALLIIKQLTESLGCEHNCDDYYENLKNSEKNLKFEQFLKLIEFKELNGIECVEPLNEAVDEMYLTYIEDVLRKGFLYRRGYLLPTLREYWFVLQPGELSYYKHSSESVVSGTVPIDSRSTVKPCPSQPSGKSEKFQRFILTTGDRTYELATQDHRSRLQWIAAIQLAITYSAGKQGFQRDLAVRRRAQREKEMTKRRDEEILKTNHLKETESVKKQLEIERLARLAAESQARKFEEVAREDSRRVAELEDVKLTLEKLLKEEQQAKRDEEIVRALQARVLAEEWEKREELEKLQEEQRLYLEEERKKREQFENLQRDKETELKNAEAKLKVLEVERSKLDNELRQARNKILHAERTKEILADRLNEIEYPDLKEGEGIRRAISLSTKQRPIISVEARAATLRKSKV